MIIIKAFNKSVFVAYSVLVLALVVVLGFGKYASERQSMVSDDSIIDEPVVGGIVPQISSVTLRILTLT